jgi:hypothetical protein
VNSNSRRKSVKIEEITKALQSILVPGQVTELRALDAIVSGDRRHQTFSGYFDNAQDFAKAAASILTAKAIYFIPNPIKPDLLARAANRIRPAGKDPTTSDRDIAGRSWLLIDLDPERPAGISATDAEHQAALDRAKQIRAELRAAGWPEPIIADSGNGGHLMYRIDLPAEDGGLVQRCLEALAAEFSDDLVKVDTSVHNPARIWKTPGTLARKGDDTPDRPHRLACIIDSPVTVPIVAKELLEKLASTAPQDAKKKGSSSAPTNGAGNRYFDIEKWIADHRLDMIGPKPWNGAGRIWQFRRCPWNPEHTNGSAFIGQQPSGAITAGCHHDGCKEKGWHELRDVVEPGWQDRRRATNSEPGRSSAKSQADRLVELALGAGIELFHTPGGDCEAFLTIPVGNHHETMRVSSKRFRTFLCRLLWMETAKAPTAQGLQEALGVLAGRALFEGDEHPVAVRLAEHCGDIYLDLANQDWQAVRISAVGWEIVSNSPVRFIRPRGVLPLSVPVQGGHVRELREFVNVATDADFTLLTACIVAYLRPKGPFPVLAIHGEQGSAKSTATRIIRELTDPNVAPLRSEPREPRDLMIAASNGWILAFENLSSIPVWLSDALCRLATGGGFSTRELFSDGEEKLFDSQRPVIVNGIVEVVTRPDLADRAVAITLPSIPDEKRSPESEFWPRFNRARPRILGALLDLVSTALRRLPETRFDRLPRMADFALWATAALDDGFMAAYAGNRAGLNETALESCPIVRFLLILLDKNKGKWEGAAGQLLEGLNALATDVEKRQKDWPTKPNVLSGMLRRIAPNLRKTEVNVDFDQRDPKTRRKLIIVTARKEGETIVRTVRSVQGPDYAGDSERRTSSEDRSDHRSDGSGSSRAAPPNTAGNAGSNGANDANDESPAQAGDAEENVEWRQ